MGFNRAKPSSSSVMRKAAMQHYNKPLVKRNLKTIVKTKPRPAAKPAPNPVAPERKPVTGGYKYKTREDISAKLVQKTVVKRFVKTQQKSAKPEEKTTRPEKKSEPTAVTVAPEESKKEVQPAPVDPELDGHYELNPLMTRMLESELQDIMIKVWQELPDEPLSDAEKLVTDKLRNKAGDDLRNVLGLNITKRLLNVYNPLFVKAEFSKKPESKHVKAFLYEFGCDRLLANNIIQMKNIADFDRICSAKGIRCGDAKVNIVPCFKFMRCPSKLKTIYGDINAAEKKKIAETADINNELLKTVDNVKVETKPDSEFANETKYSEEKSIPDKPELTKTVDLKRKPDSEEKSVPEKPELTITSDLKTKQDSEDKTIPEKPALSKTVDLNKKTDSEEKSKAENQALTKAVDLKNKPDSEEKSIPEKPNEKPQKLLKVDPQVAKDKPSRLNTAPKEKGAEINKTKKSNDLDNSKVTKKVTDTKTVNIKKLEGKITKNNDKINKILASDNKNDDDELDDEDILALISEGIVLDECSGSDGE